MKFKRSQSLQALQHVRSFPFPSPFPFLLFSFLPLLPASSSPSPPSSFFASFVLTSSPSPRLSLYSVDRNLSHLPPSPRRWLPFPRLFLPPTTHHSLHHYLQTILLITLHHSPPNLLLLLAQPPGSTRTKLSWEAWTSTWTWRARRLSDLDTDGRVG